jgi:hypothetical protein
MHRVIIQDRLKSVRTFSSQVPSFSPAAQVHLRVLSKTLIKKNNQLIILPAKVSDLLGLLRVELVKLSFEDL